MKIFEYYFDLKNIVCVTPFQMSGRDFEMLKVKFKVYLKSGQTVEVEKTIKHDKYFKRIDNDHVQYLSTTGDWVTISILESVDYIQLAAYQTALDQYNGFVNRLLDEGQKKQIG